MRGFYRVVAGAREPAERFYKLASEAAAVLLPPVMDSEIVNKVAARLGLSSCAVSRCRSNNNSVYRLGDAYVLKFAIDPVRSPVLEEEARICRRLLLAGLPVPRIVDDFVVNERHCILYKQFRGQTAEELAQKELPFSIWRKSGEFLSGLADKRGLLAHEASSVPRIDWDHLRRILDRHGCFDQSLGRLLSALRVIHDDDTFRCFCHADYGPSQILFDPAGNLVVIDWEGGGTGNLLYSAGRFLAMIEEYIDGDKVRMKREFVAGLTGRVFSNAADHL